MPLFLTLVCAGIAAYFAWRLEGSRLGRAWMAVRDDEDVAQALGINLVKVKLLAYGLGAAFAGLSGTGRAPQDSTSECPLTLLNGGKPRINSIVRIMLAVLYCVPSTTWRFV